MKSLFKSIFQTKKYNKFCILAHARTGSNFLSDCIKNSPTIVLHHEIFAHHKRTVGENFEAIFQSHFDFYPKNISNVGFKLFYYHLSPEEKEKFNQMNNLKIIHLKRKNKLSTIVSLDVANQTKKWSLLNEDNTKKETQKVTIDTSTLIDRITTIELSEETFLKDFKGEKIIEVVYEDLVSDNQKEMEKIFNFLNVDHPENIVSKHKKQRKSSLKDVIENITEVETTLKGSKYESYLLD